MATEYLFSNNATTTLAQSISATATILNVASGDGALFPSPASGQAFAVTLVDAATGLTNEICYCTSRSGDQLTVIRGQEGTNATSWQAGDTCANYITADVMESWLQESDLDGYLTQVNGDARYVRFVTDNVNWPVQYVGINQSNNAPWFKSGPNYYFLQPAGDYATNSALTTETQRASTVESNLQSSKVNRSGDSMTGPISISYNGGIGVSLSGVSGGPITQGNTPWSPQFETILSGDGSLKGRWCVRDKVSSYPYMSWQLTDQSGNFYELQYRSDDRLYTAGGNVFALETDISNLQNQINTKQAAGNYIQNNNANSKFYCWNVMASSGDTINFPVEFTDVSSIVICLTSLDTSRGAWLTYDNVTTTSFTLHGRYMSHGNLDQMPDTQVSVMVYGW